VEGKRVVSKVNDLRFYSKPSWLDRDVAGTLDAGEGFTIDEKVRVNGSPQFKVHNSNGHTYYIITGNSYIHV
ncbi:N-acetylmuramoyl-L-alanine amidase, partial [Bacillus cereus]|nr:N-acetylmuramoyl-L-alanine amidase [Bacillus cereus]